jgi:predicted small integral membrane protein
MTDMLQWMAWTLPTAAFFIGIAIMMLLMTIWQFASPTVERKGFLPIKTTRGDRLFIGLLSAAYIHLAWLGLTELNLWWAFGISVIWLLVLLRWG